MENWNEQYGIHRSSLITSNKWGTYLCHFNSTVCILWSFRWNRSVWYLTVLLREHTLCQLRHTLEGGHMFYTLTCSAALVNVPCWWPLGWRSTCPWGLLPRRAGRCSRSWWAERRMACWHLTPSRGNERVRDTRGVWVSHYESDQCTWNSPFQNPKLVPPMNMYLWEETLCQLQTINRRGGSFVC